MHIFFGCATPECLKNFKFKFEFIFMTVLLNPGCVSVFVVGLHGAVKV